MLPPRKAPAQPTKVYLYRSLAKYRQRLTCPEVCHPALYNSASNEIIAGSDVEQLEEELAAGGVATSDNLGVGDGATVWGLVEPMRVHDAHSGKGLAGTMLREGMDRLVRRGCTRLKIGFEDTNPASRKAYLGAGFVPYELVPAYIRPAVGPTGIR